MVCSINDLTTLAIDLLNFYGIKHNEVLIVDSVGDDLFIVYDVKKNYIIFKHNFEIAITFTREEINGYYRWKLKELKRKEI